MANIGSLAVQITGSTTGLAASLRQAGMQVNQFKATIDKDGKLDSLSISGKLGGEIGSLSSAMGGLVGMATAFGAALTAAAVGGLGKLTSYSLELAGNMETTLTEFEVMLNSADKAKKLVGDIRSFANTTPLTLNESLKGAGMLLQSGFKENEIVDSLRVAGDLTGGGEKMQAFLRTYTQVIGKGRLMAEEAQQFIESTGVSVLPLLEKSMGKTTAEINQMISAGRLAPGMLAKAFNDATAAGGMFAGRLEKVGQTFNGLKSTLNDAFDNAATNFGTMLIRELDLKGLMKELTSGFERATGDGSGLKNFVREFKPLVWDLGRCSIQLIEAGKWLLEFVTPAAKFSVELVGAVNRFGDFVYDFVAGVERLNDGGKGVFDPNSTGTGGDFGGDPGSLKQDPAKWFGDLFGSSSTGGLPELQAKLTIDDIKQLQQISDKYNPINEIKRKIDDLNRLRDLGGFKDNPAQ